MAEAQRRRWTLDTYLAWEAEQPTRNELVDGEVCAMVGGTIAHGRIGTNLRGHLWTALRGRQCEVQGPDTKVATGTGNVRYPDALIDCGRPRPADLLAAEPVAVFEVLSRSTAWMDQSLKLRDYEATSSIRHYILISQDEPRALMYSRDGDGRLDIRNAALIEGPDAAIALPSLGITIPLAGLYEGLDP